MTDQAHALRQMIRQQPAREYGGGSRVPTMVVGSGKGGVGQSVVATVLAGALARRGLRVLLVDGDDNFGNLHLLVNAEPSVWLDALFDGRVAVGDLVVPVTERLALLPGASGSERVRTAGPLDRARVFQWVADTFVDYDMVVVDAGSGVDGLVRACAAAGTRMLLVTMPEPAALTDAFAVTKMVQSQIRGMPVDLVVNRVFNDDDGRRAAGRLHTACQRFLNLDVPLLATIPEDAAVTAAVRHGANVLDIDPHCAMANAGRSLAATLGHIAGFAPVGAL